MLKTLTLAGVVLAASTGIAFADPSDSTTTTETTTTTTDTTATSDTAAAAPQATKHRHHKKHKKHHRHYYKSTANSDMAPSADVAPTGGYKGEMPCPTCPRPIFNTGAYVGLGVGSVVNYLSLPAVSTEIQGTLFGGYSMLWDQLYGAVEIFVSDAAVINNYNYNVLGDARNGSANSSWSYGISVLPGYMLNDQVLGFLRLGVLNTRFTTAGGNNETGGQVGLGMQTSLTPCWDLRGEWDYNFYNSMNIGAPKSQQFNLGLLYKFTL